MVETSDFLSEAFVRLRQPGSSANPLVGWDPAWVNETLSPLAPRPNVVKGNLTHWVRYSLALEATIALNSSAQVSSKTFEKVAPLGLTPPDSGQVLLEVRDLLALLSRNERVDLLKMCAATENQVLRSSYTPVLVPPQPRILAEKPKAPARKKVRSKEWHDADEGLKQAIQDAKDESKKLGVLRLPENHPIILKKIGFMQAKKSASRPS
jgi:hypothetical protein